jgi:hypothetical protein
VDHQLAAGHELLPRAGLGHVARDDVARGIGGQVAAADVVAIGRVAFA